MESESPEVVRIDLSPHPNNPEKGLAQGEIPTDAPITRDTVLLDEHGNRYLYDPDIYIRRHGPFKFHAFDADAKYVYVWPPDTPFVTYERRPSQ